MYNMNIKPSLKEFLKIPKGKNLVVFSCTFSCDYLTPVSLYDNLRRTVKGDGFLLESVEGQEKISRYSFIGAHPLLTFKSFGKKIIIEGITPKQFTTKTDPLSELKKLMDQFRVWPKEHLRFFGGFIGYVGYDYVKFCEPVGTDLPDTIKSPDLHFILPKYLIIFDHVKKEIEVLSFLILKGKATKSLYQKELRSLDRLISRITSAGRLKPLELKKKRRYAFKSNFTKKKFTDAVKKAKKLIREGEIIQVVLSQRLRVDFKKDPFMVYRYLRILNPSPYMYYLDFKDTRIAGASPEMLLRCEDKKLITRPIAGTRKRGKDEAEDQRLAKDLLNDPKERAEHIMLVDLSRNDLGRVARKASVEVPVFMKIERFSHVMHIVSETTAILDKKHDMFTALRACFPAGTLSGAPKVRAMQIINDLEPQKRGIYGGAIGYFSFTNALDTCIIIRTVVFKGKKAYVQAGAGIVADSVPEKEYQETLNKAKAQLIALEMVE